MRILQFRAGLWLVLANSLPVAASQAVGETPSNPWGFWTGVLGAAVVWAGAKLYGRLRFPGSRRIRLTKKVVSDVLSHLPDGTTLVDTKGTILWQSESIQNVLGWTLADLEGTSAFDLLHPDDVPQALEALEVLIRTPGSEFRLEFRACHRDGTIVPIECSAKSALDVDEIGAVILTTRDISERVAAKAALEEAKAVAERLASDKVQFLAVLAHEIRTPLQAVNSALSSMASDRLTERERQELQGLSLQSAGSLLQILDDLLDLSREQSRVVPVRSVPFDPVEITQEVAKLFDSPAREKGGSVQASVQGAIDRILGDSSRIRQILANLAGNAVRHAPGAPVEIVFRAEPSEPGSILCVWEVRDRGPGLSPQEAAELFRMWNRGGKSKGSGLGLAIVRGLAEVLGGSVEALPRQGGGLVVRVCLPMKLAPDTPPTSSFSDTTMMDAFVVEAPRVLVAEDDRTNQLVIRKQLEGLGCRTVVVGDGQAAVDEIRQGAFDLVLMDCQMPVLDGYAACREIRDLEATRPKPRTPVIAVTAWAMQSDKDLCFQSGMDEVLTKPLRQAELAEALSRWIPGSVARRDRSGRHPSGTS